MNWAFTSFTHTGIMLLLFGEYLADRLSKRLILLLSASGLDLLFIPLAFVSSHAVLLLTLFFWGICASCYDLVINSIGGDNERPYTSDAMTLFHAGFSCDAALMAVGAVALMRGIGLRSVHVTTVVLFLLLAGAVLRIRLPSSA